MDQLGHARSTHGQGTKEGTSWSGVPQKNAYARLLQQHHSGRFKFYLNYIAQKLQLEESGLGDASLDKDPALKGGHRESPGRNGASTHGYSPNKPSSRDNPGLPKFERGNELGETHVKSDATAEKHRRRDTGTSKVDDVTPEEESPQTKQRVKAVLHTSGSKQAFSNSSQGSVLKMFYEPDCKGDPLCGKQKIKAQPQLDINNSLREQPAEDETSANAVKPGSEISDLAQGGDKRGFARIRNHSEGASTPPSLDRKRQLSESYGETMHNADFAMIPGQAGTPRGGNRSAGSTPNDKNRSRGRKRNLFDAYMTKEEVSAELKRGQLIQGPLRINPKKFHEAFVPSPDGLRDIFIDGVVPRNRALNGDVVVLKLLPREQWKVIKPDGGDSDGEAVTAAPGLVQPSEHVLPQQSVKGEAGRPDVIIEAQLDSGTEEGRGSALADCVHNLSLGNGGKAASKLNNGMGAAKRVSSNQSDPRLLPDNCLQKTAKVVYILEKKHSRAATGFIKPLTDKNSELSRKCALFSPVDHRLPRVYVQRGDCPDDFVTRPEDYANTLFICRITDWRQDSNFAQGQLMKSLGQAGEIEPETEGILMEYGVDFSDFSNEVLQCLPQSLPWTIPQGEFRKRKDLRKDCIFTIDPATARDLDDALSCKLLPDGNFEVGVHIADVSYFVQEGSELDVMAGVRATSVYLVQKVIPMLPRLLCEELCSLNPMTDRLTFSVIWKITPQGKILDEWFGRSVICSCVKLSYDHAQSMIEEPHKLFGAHELPPVSPQHPIDEIHQAVLNLHLIAQNLRTQRFDEGALRLDQLKLAFTLDKESGMPQGCYIYQYRDSNKLVEEFMLLANMAVAHRIYRTFPEQALLRRHPPPQNKLMRDLVEFCDQMGLNLDFANSGALHKSLNDQFGMDEYSAARKEVLTHMCSRPMQMAVYFCTGALKAEHLFHHYALNVPLYTHFTSPIRRFADIIVHRLLAASIGCGPSVKLPQDAVQKQAGHCNDRKTASKRVQELSAELFFSVFVKESGPLESEAMVMGVLNEAFDVLVLRYGVQKRIYCNALPLVSSHFQQVGKKPELTLLWEPEGEGAPPVAQVISIFSLLDVVLRTENVPLKYSAVLKRPGDEQV